MEVYEPDYDAILREYINYVDKNDKLRERIDTTYLPCKEYLAYSRWQPPETVVVLFLAESPPWSGKKNYFYNENYRPPDGKRNLRSILFEKLDLRSNEEGLTDFKAEGFFLSDSVKCVFRKRLSTDTPGTGKKTIPDSLIELSVEKVLEEEVACIEPRIIFLLGKTSRKALRYIDRFNSALKDTCFGDRVYADNVSIIYCPFLNERNLNRFETEIDKAFKELKTLL